MAYFAQIDSNNIVTHVIAVPDEQEHRGQEFINKELNLPGTWIQTSYNTRRGKHKYGKMPLRKNFAGVGSIYDPQRDAFSPPKPFPSAVLNEETYCWQYPVRRPNDGKKYIWDESIVNWKEVT